jgi:replication-associated recombination protein RarA
LVSSTFGALLAQERIKKVFNIDNNVIGFIVIYLARSPKSRHTDYLGGVIFKRKEKGWKPEIPTYAIDQHTQRGRDLGKSDYDFFREGSLIRNKKGIEGEETVKRECLALYQFTEKRDESLF